MPQEDAFIVVINSQATAFTAAAQLLQTANETDVSMSDDLSYVQSRIPDYRAYDQERARSDSDMRVRAFVGNKLTRARLRVADTLDADTTKALDDVLLRCMFSDQVFIRKFEHARLDDSMLAALVRSDRHLLELAGRTNDASTVELLPILIDIDKEFEYRRSPEPVVS